MSEIKKRLQIRRHALLPGEMPLEGEMFWDYKLRRVGFWDFATSQINWFRIPHTGDSESYIPRYEWDDAGRLRFQDPNGGYGEWIDVGVTHVEAEPNEDGSVTIIFTAGSARFEVLTGDLRGPAPILNTGVTTLIPPGQPGNIVLRNVGGYVYEVDFNVPVGITPPTQTVRVGEIPVFSTVDGKGAVGSGKVISDFALASYFDNNGILKIENLSPSLFAAPVVSSGGIVNLTTEQQTQILGGSNVVTSDGRYWVYSGTGSKTDETNYITLLNSNPEWSVISGKPTFSNVAISGQYGDLNNLPTVDSFTDGSRLAASAGDTNDWNDVKSSGWVFSSTASNPPATGNWLAEVLAYTFDPDGVTPNPYVIQVLHRVDLNVSAVTEKYRRYFRNGLWTPYVLEKNAALPADIRGTVAGNLPITPGGLKDASAWVASTSTGTTLLDASKFLHAIHTITGNVTVSLTNMIPGVARRIIFKGDDATERTISWSGLAFKGYSPDEKVTATKWLDAVFTQLVVDGSTFTLVDYVYRE